MIPLAASPENDQTDDTTIHNNPILETRVDDKQSNIIARDGAFNSFSCSVPVNLFM